MVFLIFLAKYLKLARIVNKISREMNSSDYRVRNIHDT